MIIDAVVNVLLAPFLAPLSVLPTATTLFPVNTWATDIVAQIPPLGWVNDYFPIQPALAALALILAVLAVLLLVNFAIWVYHQIWGSN